MVFARGLILGLLAYPALESLGFFSLLSHLAEQPPEILLNSLVDAAALREQAFALYAWLVGIGFRSGLPSFCFAGLATLHFILANKEPETQRAKLVRGAFYILNPYAWLQLLVLLPLRFAAWLLDPFLRPVRGCTARCRRLFAEVHASDDVRLLRGRLTGARFGFFVLCATVCVAGLAVVGQRFLNSAAFALDRDGDGRVGINELAIAAHRLLSHVFHWLRGAAGLLRECWETGWVTEDGADGASSGRGVGEGAGGAVGTGAAGGAYWWNAAATPSLNNNHTAGHVLNAPPQPSTSRWQHFLSHPFNNVLGVLHERASHSFNKMPNTTKLVAHAHVAWEGIRNAARNASPLPPLDLAALVLSDVASSTVLLQQPSGGGAASSFSESSSTSSIIERVMTTVMTTCGGSLLIWVFVEVVALPLLAGLLSKQGKWTREKARPVYLQVDAMYVEESLYSVAKYLH